MILITGGAGYIGSHVNKMLANAGRETLVFDNLTNGHSEFLLWGNFVFGDLEDSNHLERVFRRFPISGVMHFAAYAYVRESLQNPAKYHLNNIRGTLNLLEVMLRHGINKIIFSSTCAVYGVAQQTPILEAHPQVPINPYGRSKLIIEQILSDYSLGHDLRYVALRYFNAAGADLEGQLGEWHEPETHLIPLVLDAAMGRGGELTIFGQDHDTPDGTCLRDYIHVTDLASAHVLAYEYLENGGASLSLNLGNGNGHSVSQVLEAVRKVTGKTIPVLVGECNPGDPPILVGGAQKAMETLGWKPLYGDLETIIETAWKWHNKVFS